MVQNVYAYIHSMHIALINTHSGVFCWFLGASTAGKMQGCPAVGKMERGRAKSRKYCPSIQAFLSHRRANLLCCRPIMPSFAPSATRRELDAPFMAWLGWRKTYPGDALLSSAAIRSMCIRWDHPLRSDAEGDGGRSSFPRDWTWQGCPHPNALCISHAPLIIGDKFLQLLGQRVVFTTVFTTSRTTELHFWCLKIDCR